MNLFAYALNNPINITDPSGLQARDIIDAIGQLSNFICREIRQLSCPAGKICSVIILGAAATVAVVGAVVIGTALIVPGAAAFVGVGTLGFFAAATPVAVVTSITAAEDVFRQRCCRR